MKKIIFGCLCVFASIAATKINAQTNFKFSLSDSIKISGDTGWDYLTTDDSTGRVFISHGIEVQVLNEKTKKIIGTIPDTKGVHGIAIANELNKGFISDGKDSAVTVFNLTTLKTIIKIPVTGQNPDCILYDSFTHRVFAFNGHTSNVTVIDGTNNKIIGTIYLDGRPEFAVSNQAGKIYLNLEDKSMICEINSSTLKVERTWSISPGDGPSGLAIDIKNNILFSVCDNKTMVILNAQTGKIITTLPIGDRVDAVAFDPFTQCAYSSNGDGTLTIVHEENPTTFSVIQTIKTKKGARTLAVDKKTHRIYLPTADFGAVPEQKVGEKRKRPNIKKNSFVLLEIDLQN
ncbi:MAG: YncE family protein [Bacteroidia bacterium]